MVSSIIVFLSFEALIHARYHLGNPYWKTFDPYIVPLLEKPIELHRHNEIDTSKEVRVEKDPELWKAVAEHQKQ